MISLYWLKFWVFCPSLLLLLQQDIKLDDLETNHFVLVHGGGFGAWCWYKTIALLEEGGFKVTAVDLTGSGVHSSDTNGVASLSQYVKPLTNFLEELADGEKVLFHFFVVYHCAFYFFLQLVSKYFPIFVKITTSIIISTMCSNWFL